MMIEIERGLMTNGVFERLYDSFSALRGICAALRTAIRIDLLGHQGKFDS